MDVFWQRTMFVAKTLMCECVCVLASRAAVEVDESSTHRLLLTSGCVKDDFCYLGVYHGYKTTLIKTMRLFYMVGLWDRMISRVRNY